MEPVTLQISITDIRFGPLGQGPIGNRQSSPGFPPNELGAPTAGRPYNQSMMVSLFPVLKPSDVGFTENHRVTFAKCILSDALRFRIVEKRSIA